VTSPARESERLLELRAPAEQAEGSRSQVLRWLKGVGECVARDEPLIELETDKVTVEVAAPVAGVVREILKQEREQVEPGDVLARIEAATQTPAIEPKSTVAGALSSLAYTPRVRGRHEEQAVNLSPAVRRLLAERGLDAATIRGSAPGGRITVDDVLQYAQERDRLPPTQPRVTPPPSSATPAPAQHGVRFVPHSAVRRRIAEHMVRSLLQTAPHVTSVFEADLTAVLAHQAQHREAFAAQGVALTVTAYIIAACSRAIHEVPEANARWTDEALEIFEPIHIGIATAVEGQGLIVPVMRDVASLDLLGIARELQRLVSAAREGQLEPTDVQGGTFTISNHGVSGSLLAAPIVIHQPQVAILGVGKLEKRPVVVTEGGDEQIKLRPRCYITLTIDHRAMDGDRANRLLTVLTDSLAKWPTEATAAPEQRQWSIP
jgi:2-oxoglutarate dehydrogenase E2 component (dihydrolipoamide succinyltransferase)